MNQSRYLRNGVLCVLSTVISTHVYSHDTTHIHPLITAKIRQLIQDTDSSTSAYLDLYKLDPSPIAGPLPQDQFLYWGTDFDPAGIAGAGDKQSYLFEDNLKPYSRYNNVIDGVVQEDAPAEKVLNHFFHGKDGSAFSIGVGNTASDIRAMTLFNESVSLMSGYDESAKQISFFVFGQSLHHVEDMSSPAHIHNDSHLVFSDEEKDDYEGYYLPQMKQDMYFGSQLSGSVNGININLFAVDAVRVISNPWSAIWGKVDEYPDSMVAFFYKTSVFHGDLQFNYSEVIDTIPRIVIYAPLFNLPAPCPETSSIIIWS